MTTDNGQQNPGGNGEGSQGDKGNGDQPNPQMVALENQIQQLESTIANLRSVNATVAEQYRDIAVSLVPESQKQRVEDILRTVNTNAEEANAKSVLEQQAKDLTIRELVLDNKEYGLTTDMLKDAKTTAEMELIAAENKVEFFKKQSDGGAKPSQITSDKGGGSGGSAPPQLEGKGINAVAKLIGQSAAEKRGQHANP